MQAHDSEAPPAYPEVHHVTSPLRAAARAAGDATAINLWAGQAYTLARPLPAAEIVAAIASEASDALQRAGARLGGPWAVRVCRELGLSERTHWGMGGGSDGQLFARSPGAADATVKRSRGLRVAFACRSGDEPSRRGCGAY